MRTVSMFLATVLLLSNTNAQVFAANGGESDNVSTTYSYDAKGLTLNDGKSFVKKGYHVTAWFKEPQCRTGNYKPGATVKNLWTKDESDLTLYAKWTPNTYTIKYDGNGAISGKAGNKTLIFVKLGNMTISTNVKVTQ